MQPLMQTVCVSIVEKITIEVCLPLLSNFHVFTYNIFELSNLIFRTQLHAGKRFPIYVRESVNYLIISTEKLNFITFSHIACTVHVF